jgi:hypothetical protein
MSGDRNVYLYWVGKEFKLITILRDLIYLHSTNGIGYKVHLITDKNIGKYIKNIPDYFSSLCPAHQADFVRVHVICDYGGIWLDSDTIVVDKLDSLFDLIEKKNGFFIKENNIHLVNGVFGSKKQTELMLQWKSQITDVLNSKTAKNIKWTDIGSSLLKKIYDSNKTVYTEYEIFEGLDNLYPIYYKFCVNEFIEKPYDNYKNIVRKYQPLVVLVNSVYKKLEDKTEKEILEGNMPINYFINKSFENSRKIIFLKISKNAGTMMTQVFKNSKYEYVESYFIEDWNRNKFFTSKIITLAHQTNISNFKKTYSKLFEYANKLIIFRNPIERVISSYNYLKYNKGYHYYLNKIDRSVKKCDKNNYNKDYIHFDILQLDSIDYDKNTYHSDLYYYIDMSCLKLIDEFFIKNNLDIRIIKPINKSTKYSFPDESEMDLIYSKYKPDIEYYKRMFNYAKL